MSNRRVVVTGLGMLSPIGNDVPTSWQSALAGKSGAGPIEAFDAADYSVRIVAALKDFDPGKFLDTKEVRRIDGFIQVGLGAGIEAVEDAGLEANPVDAHRYGIAIGSGIGGINTIEQTHSTLLKGGPRRVSPFFVPSSVITLRFQRAEHCGGYRVYYGDPQHRVWCPHDSARRRRRHGRWRRGARDVAHHGSRFRLHESAFHPQRRSRTRQPSLGP